MSVFVVDNELSESVKELGQIIDTIEGSTSFSETLTLFVDVQKNEITNKADLIQKVYEASSPDYLKKLSDKEFEPAFNLIIYILTQLAGGIESVLESDKNDVLLTNLIKSSPSEQLSLRDRKSIKATSILSELTLIFNLLPKTSSLRVKIIDEILSFVEKLKIDFKILQNSFNDNLVLWLQEAKATDSKIREVFWAYIELDNKFSFSSLQSISKFTRKYQLNLNELHQLIKFCFNSDTIDVSFLVNNNVNQALDNNASDALVSTFIKYLKGEQLENSSEYPNLHAKSQILALCKYFEQADKYEFQFSEIPVASSTELEVLLINAIKNGLVEGKLDQTKSAFYLTRVNKVILPSDAQTVSKSLQDVQKNLDAWKASLVSVGEVVNSFRENIK